MKGLVQNVYHYRLHRMYGSGAAEHWNRELEFRRDMDRCVPL